MAEHVVDPGVNRSTAAVELETHDHVSVVALRYRVTIPGVGALKGISETRARALAAVYGGTVDVSKAELVISGPRCGSEILSPWIPAGLPPRPPGCCCPENWQWTTDPVCPVHGHSPQERTDEPEEITPEVLERVADRRRSLFSQGDPDGV